MLSKLCSYCSTEISSFQNISHYSGLNTIIRNISIMIRKAKPANNEIYLPAIIYNSKETFNQNLPGQSTKIKEFFNNYTELRISSLLSEITHGTGF